MEDWWIRKRFNKKKTIEVEGEKKGSHYRPMMIKDGDESKEGGGAVEISFENVEKDTDIYFSLTPVEREKIDFDEEYAVYWFDRDKCLEEKEFTVYYGCKNRWARLFDRCFIEKETGYSDDTKMVQHLTDFQR